MLCADAVPETPCAYIMTVAAQPLPNALPPAVPLRRRATGASELPAALAERRRASLAADQRLPARLTLGMALPRASLGLADAFGRLSVGAGSTAGTGEEVRTRSAAWMTLASIMCLIHPKT